jgi:two-component system, NarL family, sensor histidine kinase DevS
MVDAGTGSEAAPRWPGASRLDIEDLLAEIRSRVTASRRSQERVGALLDAVVAVSADLELAEVLTRIVRSACALVGARYGALGVLGPDREHLMEFITHGVTPEERARIGEPPRGHGVLGLLIREPRPRRLGDIQKHPDSYGFPPNHPPMHSFLGVPIRIRDQVFGNLYMAEKIEGEEFTQEDEGVLVALAAAASVAIDNARLYSHSQQQMRWSAAVGELTQNLLEARGEEAALGLMAAQAQGLSSAQMAAIALYDESDDLILRSIHIQADEVPEGAQTVGSTGADLFGVKPVEVGSALNAAAWRELRDAGQPLLLLSPPDEPAASGLAREVRAIAPIGLAGPTAVVPLAAGVGNFGVLVVAWHSASPEVASDVMPLLGEFAKQGALALMAARAQRDKSRMALLEDRDRIARDMHDHVIQRLFATGLSLQSAIRFAQHPVVQARVEDAVTDLDSAIRDIRHAIFELHRPIPDGGAEIEVTAMVEGFADSLGFAPEVTIDGSIEGLPPSLQADLVAVVREGLSNMSRHSKATEGSVDISIDRDRLSVMVTDNGIGVDPASARGGLINLGERAAARSGRFDLRPGSPVGTVLSWQVPRNHGVELAD